MSSTTCELRQRLGDHVAAYHAAVLSGPAAAAEVAEFARIERLAAAGRMLAAGRVADTKRMARQRSPLPRRLARRPSRHLGV
ncbi:hypothetical protein BH23ACT2_BH23ACT2_13560 [soil metagenome]